MNVIFLPIGDGQFACVDSDSSEEIWGQKWSALRRASGKAYAYRSTRVGEERRIKTHITLHAQITDSSSNTEVDHINGDSLDNRRRNLRICRHFENGRNLAKWSSPTSSKFKGVCHRLNGKWMAYIVLSGKQSYIGVFKTEEDAARAYDTEAVKLHGKFARLNFPV